MAAAKPVIILTRPSALSAAFAETILADGICATVLEAPVTRIDPVASPPPVTRATGAIFTSRNGVAHAPSGASIAWCVGDKTAESAAEKGWEVRSAAGDAEAVFKRICADLKGQEADQHLVHYCGAETRGNLSERLTDVGIFTEKHIVYRQEMQALSSQVLATISGSKKVIFPIFSPNSAQRLTAQLPSDTRADFVAISQRAANAIPPEMISRLAIAQAPDAYSVLAALRGLV